MGGVLFSAFPGLRGDEVFARLSPYLNNPISVPTVLDTGFASVNVVIAPDWMHQRLSLDWVGRIELSGLLGESRDKVAGRICSHR
ncbi:MAG: hypothetical protein QME87_12385 [Bacillota bacterium]|nr:hypothetical protein [Bacillota bacterium]